MALADQLARMLRAWVRAGLIAPVRECGPRTAIYLRRQIGFTAGINGISDFDRTA
ncbi:hypothetical protein [Nonomuraea diastatica]|uniref:hypothetical protein n=1 Tax=Nonomuraea diastatica TaxID=1848329 RepID=UPI001407CB20|nr:hypothetical protein [Nonomuraea diastatica]